MFAYSGMDMKDIENIIISTVVPPLLVPLCNMCKRFFSITPFVVTSEIKTGLKLDYDDPSQIGADRIVNAVAAHNMYGDKGNLIIIDFGTATTFCALTPAGEYLGGAIAPGIGISTEALFQKAAKLPTGRPGLRSSHRRLRQTDGQRIRPGGRSRTLPHPGRPADSA